MPSENCILTDKQAMTTYGIQETDLSYEYNEPLEICCTPGFVIRPQGQKDPVKSAEIICSREQGGATFLLRNRQYANSTTCQIGKLVLNIFIKFLICQYDRAL